MKRTPQGIHVSASDLTDFLACPYLTYLKRRDIDMPVERAPADEQAELIRKKGEAHERMYLEKLKAQGREVVDCKADYRGVEERAAFSRAQLEAGKAVAYQACFAQDRFFGYSDFVERVETPSALGPFSYETVDTKLATSMKPYFIIQLCFYSELLGLLQGRMPENIHIVLGTGERRSYPVIDYFSYYVETKKLFLEFVDRYPDCGPVYPAPCGHCRICDFKDYCAAMLEADDHLSLVANIRSSQIKKLQEAGITTVRELAEHDGSRIPRFAEASLSILRRQAALQVRARDHGGHYYEFLDQEKKSTGFYLLCEPHPGDLFYDIEGDPLFEGGLEYLHGICTPDGNYRPFRALSKEDEKKCFEELMDFMSEHIEKNPGAHIYHYASYEVSALKRLMCRYGTKEHIVDHFLRNGKFIDLHTVVRNSLLVSEPQYSIKNLEAFYMGKRSADLKSGGDSIVWFEKYLQTGEKKLIDDIEAYNRTDCESTYHLRNWLLERKKEAEEKSGRKFEKETVESPQDEPEQSAPSSEAEALLEGYRVKLCSGLPEDPLRYSGKDRFRATLFFLVDYYRRELKPEYWEMFSRLGLSEQELLEDPECLAGLTLKSVATLPRPKRSSIYTFRFPEQEGKMKPGDNPLDPLTLETTGEVADVDYEKCIIAIKTSKTISRELALVPGKPVRRDSLIAALHRFIDACIESDSPDGPYSCLRHLLLRQKPKLSSPLLPFEEDSSSETFREHLLSLLMALNGSYLVIQGPPGTGKTYTASRLIVSLLKAGKRIGVSSNSHKAINNLLQAVEEAARESGVAFSGLKKSSREEDCFDGIFIGNENSTEKVLQADPQLFAGTAWLFSDPRLDRHIDYLFIDEAGQVSLAQVISAGTSARNLILLGDPMQLPQPSKGIHPEGIGLSVLEYIQEERATISPDKGIFMNTSRRLHSSLCKFISKYVYEGRLKSLPENDHRTVLVADTSLHGIRCIPVCHSGNSNYSEQEAEAVTDLYRSLLSAKYKNGDKISAVTPEDILVVAPYNLQVNLLKKRIAPLAPEARAGTIDKFQGQEAPIVIVSMTTSSEEEISRSMDFLFSRNRLNVALSRATSLAFVVMCPDLLRVRCNTVEQMKLVNFLCAVERDAEQTMCGKLIFLNSPKHPAACVRS